MLAMQRSIKLPSLWFRGDFHPYSDRVTDQDLAVTKRRYLRHLEFDAARLQSVDEGIEAFASKRDVIHAGMYAATMIHVSFDQVHQGMVARIQPVTARPEFRAPAITQADDIAIEFLQLCDVIGWCPDVHVIDRADGH
jgi:hypothetical protein